MRLRIVVAFLLVVLCAAGTATAQTTGVLLLAHGGQPAWNDRVTDLAAKVDKSKPTEVAFGMATRANIQSAVDRLVARGVTEIVAVPLFVSSWSSVITSTEYLLGLRAEAPPALAHFAKMNHGSAANNTGHAGHGAHAGEDGTKPVKSPVPIRMTPALNDHPIAAEILVSRARSIGNSPASEAIVIVAHGPNEENDNRKWLADMESLSRRIATLEKFASIDYLTVRDDAPKPVWEKAKAELRAVVQKRTAEGRRVLIVPLLISFGGIEKGLRERLDGLSYTMANAGLMPDDRLVTWVLAMAEGRPVSAGF
jgi:sirohydrochlorin cobaltochelatase